MTKMDDREHPDCEIFVEDERAKVWLSEILSKFAPELVLRTTIIPYGKANLGMALGQLVKEAKLPRPTVVFLDGDQDISNGCLLLPGGDAPEQVILNDLKHANWGSLSERISRDFSDVADACLRAMTLPHHHEWVRAAANELRYASDVLWHAMCAEWTKITDASKVSEIIEGINFVVLTPPD